VPKPGPYDFATAFAEKLLRDEFRINRLPINPIALAQSRGIRVEPMPKDHDGVSGMFIHAHGRSAIAYATHIKNRGFQHFSVAHELGHCFLPGHIDAVLPDGATHHASHSGFVSDNRYELEADHFAAGLLMPSRLFRMAMARAGEGLDAIEILHDRCQTSLTATAIRYQQLTDEAVAVIQSIGARIEFCFLSHRMLTLRPLRWPAKGSALPRRSATYRLNQHPSKVTASERVDGPADGVDWFGGFSDVELFEEAVGLGRYGRTLTVLTTVDGLSDDDPEEDGDANLRGQWTPRFR
jgi:Zn-dependent peptidase ImmA (M78 family)